MKFTLVFLVFGLTCAFYAATSEALSVRLMAASSALTFSGVGLAFAGRGPRAFIKKSDGRLRWLSPLIYWLYHALNWLSLWGFRRGGKENPFDKIAESDCTRSNASFSKHYRPEKNYRAKLTGRTCEKSNELTTIG